MLWFKAILKKFGEAIFEVVEAKWLMGQILEIKWNFYSYSTMLLFGIVVWIEN